jgi:class 3 adenylate cyclase/tetratricopeptide (TPR) repeat protein
VSDAGLAPTGLGRYVPRVAAEWAMDAPDRAWQEIEASLCFVDISGFTNLSERLAARGRIGSEELTEVLNRVFGGMLGLAYLRTGTLLKFGGDALLLLFRGPEHAFQAASAAVEMRTALRAAALVPTSVGRVPLRMSVGVHSGTVHLFRVGGSHHELVIAGPAASATTAMEHAADAGEIVISAATRAELPARSATTAKGPGWLLRWRLASTPGRGPQARRATRHDAIASCLPVVLRDHLAHGSAEPEHRMASVAFVQFQGTDRLLADRGPTATATALDQLVRAVQTAVDEEGVTFLATDIDADGGKIILAAGVPSAREDDEGRLLRAVRRVADAPLTLGVRIGVNHGHVFAGEVGTPFRATYTVMGDTVNLAARLMAAAPLGEVYVSPSVLERSRTMFATTALEPFSVKGKAAPVQAYALGSEVGDREATVRAELPFVGRMEELVALAEALGDAAIGGGGVLIVAGETGSGKSRLVEEALRRAPGMRVIAVRGEPYGTTSPYRALRDPLRDLLGLERADPATMSVALAKVVATVAPHLSPYLPLLADAVQVPAEPTPEVDAIEVRFRPERLAAVLIELLEVGAPGTLTIVVEDAQWLDDASSQLLDRVAAAARDRPWLVLVVRRPQAGGFVPSFGPTIELRPLADHLARELVIGATEAAPLRPHDLEAVVQRAGGSPLYLEELIRALRVAGSAEGLPDSLESLVGKEIDALAPTPRRLLRYAAVLGRSFRIATLTEVLADEVVDFDESTQRELARFLEPDTPERLRFRNAVVRDAAYEGLSYRRRRDLHLRAGEATERMAGDHPEALAGSLALHFALAQDHDRTWRYARIAGDRARQAHANVEAVSHYERALEAARRMRVVPAGEQMAVWTDLGDTREQAGLFDGALDAYRRASRLAGGPVATAQLLLKRARARERAGAFSSAMRELAAASRLVADVGTAEAARVQAQITSFRALLRQAQERPREAMVLAERATAEAEQAGEKLALARAYNVLDWAKQVLGDPDRGAGLPAALALYEELGDLEGAANVIGALGTNAYFDGRWDDAVDNYEQAGDRFRRAGNAVQAAISDSNIGEVLVNQGRLDDAEPRLRAAARVLRASGFVDGATFAEVQLARALRGLGDVVSADALLMKARTELFGLGQPASVLEASIHLADCRIVEDQPAEALDLVTDAARSGLAVAPVFAAAVARVEATALAVLGRSGEACAVAREGLEQARRQQLEFDAAQLLVLLGVLTHDPSAADEAGVLFDRLGVLLDAPARKLPSTVSQRAGEEAGAIPTARGG